MNVGINLKIASAHDVVEAGSLVPALYPTDTSVGEVVGPVSIKDLPLDGRMLVEPDS